MPRQQEMDSEDELEQTSIKLPPKMKEKLEEIARYEDRSASAQIRVFLAEKIREYFAVREKRGGKGDR
jgi:predicted transcriptional regulator